MAERETASLLNTKKAAAFLGLSVSSFYTYCSRKGLQPTKVRRSRRWYSVESLEAWRAGHPAPAPRPERKLPHGYVTTSELWAEMHRLNAAGERRPLCRQKIIDTLNAAGVPRVEISNAAGPGSGYAWEQAAALRALGAESLRAYSYPHQNHTAAPPRVLRSKAWVTCRRAAEIIGCTVEEVIGKAAKYAVKSYLQPGMNKLLVNWLEVRASLRWRRAAFIKKHLGRAGFELVRRTCQKKMFFDGAGVPAGCCYYVPELITAGNK